MADATAVESLLKQLRVEEARLKELRQRAAAEPKPRSTAVPVPYPTGEQLDAMWEDIEGTLWAGPEEAKEVLTNRFEPVVLTPTEDGWSMETAMRLGPALEVPKRLSPAALASGRAEVWPGDGCGGAMSGLAATSRPVFGLALD